MADLDIGVGTRPTDLDLGVGTRPTELNLNLGVGTVMGVGAEYTAGEGIWIEDHVINADVTQEEVDGKAAVGHKHVIADVDGLQAALDAKASTGTATTDAAGLMSAADKSKLDGFGSASTYAKKGTTLGGYGITDAYTKAQTDSAISNAVSGLYRYKGSVASVDKLPASPATGDVYNIETASKYGAPGANVAWNGSAWDSLGEVFSITAISNTEIDGILTK